MEPIGYQFSALIMAILNGMVIAFWYDIYRLCKGVFHFRGFYLACGDFFFWVTTTFITVILLFISSWGDLRVYIFLGMVIGAWFYFAAFSSLVLYVMLKPVKFLQQVLIKPRFPGGHRIKLKHIK